VLETNDRGLVRHDCDTTAGSSGALLFSAYDLAILGLHIGSADARSNQASAMYSIALASDLVRNIATIRPSTTPIIDFRTVGDKPGEIASDFKRLYLSLHNDGRLPLKQYQVSSFGGIEDAFRTNQLFYGSPFPVELDSIACDVNPNVCTRDRTEPSLEELKLGPYIRDVIPFAGRPSGKSRPSSGKWSVAPSTLLWLPSIRFEQQRGWVVYRKRAGQEIGEIVQGFGVCNQFDDQCKNLILGMNRNQDERLTRDRIVRAGCSVDIARGRSSNREDAATVGLRLSRCARSRREQRIDGFGRGTQIARFDGFGLDTHPAEIRMAASLQWQ
jgi:hypothetical protein